MDQHPNYAFLADAAKTDKEKAERTFQISSIHAVSVKELNKVATSNNDKSSDSDSEEKEVATNSYTENPEFESITETVLPDTDALTLFESNKIKVYGDEELTNDVVEYDKVNLEIERFDLGEPIWGKEENTNEDQEQITPDVINPDGSIDEDVVTSSNAESDSRQEYEVPEKETSSFEDISSDDISEAIIPSSENHTVSDDILDDYDFDEIFNENDIF